MYQLHSQLDSTLGALGASSEEKQVLLGFLLNQLASARGRVSGIENNIASFQRELEAAQAEVLRIEAMVGKFTEEVEEPPVEEPEPSV